MTVKTMVETWKSSIGDAPLTHEDHEQRGDEAEDGGAFGQGAAQQQGAVDLSGGLRLAGDGLAGLTGGKANADTRADAGETAIPAAIIPSVIMISS